MNPPHKPPPATSPVMPAQPQHPARRPYEPINPDPKTHPIHPATPPQPIHEGTDPPKPVKTTGAPE
jgi:hypothetical protein